MSGEIPMPFGKFGTGSADPRDVKDVPSDYLTWLLEQDWLEEKYGEELVEEIELVMAERDELDTHWHEYEEPYG